MIITWEGMINLLSVLNEVINLVSLQHFVIMLNLWRSGLHLMFILRLLTGEFCLQDETVKVGLVFTSPASRNLLKIVEGVVVNYIDSIGMLLLMVY